MRKETYEHSPKKEEEENLQKNKKKRAKRTKTSIKDPQQKTPFPKRLGCTCC